MVLWIQQRYAEKKLPHLCMLFQSKVMPFYVFWIIVDQKRLSGNAVS